MIEAGAPTRPDDLVSPLGPADPHVGSAPARRGVRTAAIVLVAVAAVCWATSVALTSLGTISDVGLLAAINPLFIVGVALLAVGFVIELFGGQRPLVLTLSIVLLVAMIDATVPLLSHYPEYAWTYKHIGVIELFKTGHGVTDPKDIYQLWPALFTGVAAISSLTGVAPLKLAVWAPFFFSLLQCVALFAIFRRLSADRRVAYLAVFLFQSCLWVGTSYLSPQALAFELSLGFDLILILGLRATPGPWRRGPRAARSVRQFLIRGAPQLPAVSPRLRTASLAALFVIFFAITATHQLTPYILLPTLAIVVLLGLVRPWWVLVVCAVIALIYLAPRFNDVNSSYGLLDSLSFWDNAHGAVTTTTGTHAQQVTSQVSEVEALLVWLLTIATIVRARRELGRVLLPMVFAGAPFVVLAAQSYGGEAIYRVFLFSLPWCAFLIADWLIAIRWRRVAVLPVTALVLVATTLATIQGLHGTLSWTVFSTKEIAAADYFYDNAPKGSMLVLGAANWPGRLEADYGAYGFPSSGGDPDLTSAPPFLGKSLNSGSVKALNTFMTSLAPSGYLVISKSMMKYDDYYGYLGAGSLSRLDAALQNAPGWTIFYRNSDTTIYKYK